MSNELTEDRRSLADLLQRVERLEALEEIARLIASYGPAVDSGSAAATAALWDVEGRYRFSVGPDLVTLRGRDQIEEMVQGPGHQQIINDGASHFLGSARIELDDETAVATCYSMLVRYDGDSRRHYVDRVSANRWVLRRTDGVWQVVERLNHLLDGREEARALLGQSG